MPELPEVETIRSQLAPIVQGRTIERAEVLDQRWVAPLTPRQWIEAVQGREVIALHRRGKYLHWRLEGGLHLLQHLRMSGAILCDPPGAPRHMRAAIELGPRRRSNSRPSTLDDPRSPADACDPGFAAGDGGTERSRLVVTDQRRFGTAQLLFGEEAMERFFAARLGLEPFDPMFTAEHLWRLTRNRTVPVKALLLDQRTLAGVGNIYADEALFRARIDPRRRAGTLTRAQCARLRESVREALHAGIEAKGATIDDFRHVDGVIGSFQDLFLVHRRAGEPCPSCGREIVKIIIAGRGTYVCAHCQKRR